MIGAGLRRAEVAEFLNVCVKLDLDPAVLVIEMHIEDPYENEITLIYDGSCLNGGEIIPHFEDSVTT